MEEIPTETQINAMDKGASVVLDIKSLTQYGDKCSGSPKVTKVLSRKGSNRMERQQNAEDLETDDASKKIVVKAVCSQIDQLKQGSTSSKALVSVTTGAKMANLGELADGRTKRFSRLRSVHPRNILFLFATMSSMGTILLIFFTLASTHKGGA